MGQLIIYHKGQRLEYLINTKVANNVIDKAIEDILKCFPSDAIVEFNKLF